MPIVEVDESGVVENMEQEYGKSLRGVKIEMRVNGKRSKRTNIIGALVNGVHNKEIFDENFLLESWHSRGQSTVMCLRHGSSGGCCRCCPKAA